MITKISLYQTCKESVEKSILSPVGQSICFISPKTLDLSYFAILQAIGSLSGLQYGELVLPPATGVMLVDGYSVSGKIISTVAKCESDKDLSKISILSIKSYNTDLKKYAPGPDISVIDAKVVDGLVEFADIEKQPCVVFHDLQSLTVGGTLCKAHDFRELHTRLKAKGATQLYFVNSENEALQIGSGHDLIFNITKDTKASHPTIRLELQSAAANLQDTILPMELELMIDPNGTWRVEASITQNDQDAVIKALAKMGRTRKEISATIGGISASTVGRRLHAMQERGEITIIGHRIYDTK